MRRISDKDIKLACERLNDCLLGRRKKLTHIVLGFRYGYVCVEEQEDGETSIVRTIEAGMTRRQAYNYVCAMIEGVGMTRELESNEESTDGDSAGSPGSDDAGNA